MHSYRLNAYPAHTRDAPPSAALLGGVHFELPLLYRGYLSEWVVWKYDLGKRKAQKRLKNCEK